LVLKSNPALIDATLMIDAFGDVDDLPETLPRHLDEEVQLAEDLWIGPLLPYRLKMLDLCEPRPVPKFSLASRQALPAG
jgi:hypothetical protein